MRPVTLRFNNKRFHHLSPGESVEDIHDSLVKNESITALLEKKVITLSKTVSKIPRIKKRETESVTEK